MTQPNDALKKHLVALLKILGAGDIELTRTEVGIILGVHNVTVRDWEKRGLLPPAGRNVAGHSRHSWKALLTTLRETVSRGYFPGFSAGRKPGPKAARESLGDTSFPA